MARTSLLCCLLLALSIDRIYAGWRYATVGQWSANYTTCGGQNQSPIDIDSQSAVYQDGIKLQYVNYAVATAAGDFTVINNGHAVQVTIPNGAGISITLGKNGDTYSLLQFHFHYGSDDTKGSEHTIDGVATAMEAHFVHINDKYSDLATALNYPDGLAVVGVRFVVDPNANLPEMDSITSVFGSIPHEGQSTTIPPFALVALFPQNRNIFKYQGSLTTPGCAEVVTWYVIQHTMSVTPTQMAAFRTLLYSNVATEQPDVPLVDNFRPVQPLNGRTVYTSSD